MKLSVGAVIAAIVVIFLSDGPVRAADNTSRPMLLAQATGNNASVAQDRHRSLPINAEPIRKPVPFMFGLFDAQKPVLEPLTDEQAAFDEKWAQIAKRKNYRIKDEFAPTTVSFSGYRTGSIVIDTKKKYLYFVDSPISAIRYGIAVGREGLSFTGKTTIGNKQVWPRWTPTRAMIEREPGKYRRYADGMEGGLNNPLGARAIYLHLGRNDTYLRIHGTNQPQTIGTASSNGCFRMHNEHVMDLYERVKLNAEVIIL
jgi:lipoprotein-anchoring transpeptidase ErfK/SrfK